MEEFTKEEIKLLRKLNTPAKIQDFINKIPINFELDGKDSFMSPIQVVRQNKCHCIEGASLAAFILWFNGIENPLLVDLRGTKDDCDHVICVFRDKKTRQWGCIGKTNHAVLRYREPIYKDIRELVMSMFHEYSDSKGNKTLREFSMPVDLRRFGKEWIFSKEHLWHIYEYLDEVKHFKILTKQQEKNLRKQDKIEINLDSIVEWKDPRKK